MTAPHRAPSDPFLLQVNGQPHRWTAGMTVADLLRELDFADHGLAVECNLQVIRREQHTTTVLQPGDKIEIVRLVGGG